MLQDRHRRTNIFWPFLSRFISSRFMKSWSVTIKTVWYLKPAGQMVKTGRSNSQNRQILRDWAILVLLISSTLKRDKQKCARLFKRNETSKIWRSDGQTMIDHRCLLQANIFVLWKLNIVCGQSDQKKSPNVYKSWSKMISLEK